MESKGSVKTLNNQIIYNILKANLDNYDIYINTLLILRQKYGNKISEITNSISSVQTRLLDFIEFFIGDYEKTKSKYEKLLKKHDMSTSPDITEDLETLSRETTDFSRSLQFLNHLEDEITCLKKARQSELFKSLNRSREEYQSLSLDSRKKISPLNKNGGDDIISKNNNKILTNSGSPKKAEKIQRKKFDILKEKFSKKEDTKEASIKVSTNEAPLDEHQRKLSNQNVFINTPKSTEWNQHHNTQKNFIQCKRLREEPTVHLQQYNNQTNSNTNHLFTNVKSNEKLFENHKLDKAATANKASLISEISKSPYVT